MTTELVPITETVTLPVTVDEAVRQWEEYQDLNKRLLDPSDYQRVGDKAFKKKSAWRKYARAYNLTDRVTYEHVERFPDGFPIWARVRVQATAANGRATEADHEAHVTERCCEAARNLPCPKKPPKHSHCVIGCDGRSHWSHPGDLPATALTRAKNRAIADLIGAGEISADEMTGGREQPPMPAATERLLEPPVCPVHLKRWAKRTGQYGDFWACPSFDTVDDKRVYCKERPKIGQPIAAPAVPPSEGEPPPEEEEPPPYD